MTDALVHSPVPPCPTILLGRTCLANVHTPLSSLFRVLLVIASSGQRRDIDSHLPNAIAGMWYVCACV